MNLTSKPRRTRTFKPRGFIANSEGIAAVEFALILPFMLFLYFATFQLTQAVSLNRQVSLAANTVANIISQYSTISASTQVPDVLAASSQIFQPNAPANAEIVVSLVTVTSAGKATVVWSQALNASARTAGQTITVPSTLAAAGTSLVFSEATYSYTPVYDFLHFGTSQLYACIYMVPRNSTTINLTS